MSLLFLVGLAQITLAQLSTEEHLANPGFWPTRINRNANEFVGEATCARCHAEIAASQKKTSMARTAALAAEDRSLHEHARLDFQQGRYKYQIVTSTSGTTYTATDGERSLSSPLTWVFGAGTVGQSYLYSKDGRWYEARVSFFGALNGLQFTPGRALTSPHDLEEAMSRPVGNEEVMRCFKCHATGVTSAYSVESTKTVFLGVSCEACHGPGRAHVDAMNADIVATGAVTGETGNLIFNPRRLDAVDSVDFCGACHSTLWDVRLSAATGHATMASPAYRLESSKCWGKGDPRLTCTTCHDPHSPIDRQPEHYDSKCLACHMSTANSPPTLDHPGRACPAAKARCSTCHMPKTEVPELYYAVADHQIRIVRSKAER